MIPASFVLGLFTRIVARALHSEFSLRNGPGTSIGVARMWNDRGPAFHRRRIHDTCTVSMRDAGARLIATLPTAYFRLLKVDPNLPAYTTAGATPGAGFTHRFISFLHNKHKSKNQENPAILSSIRTQ